jgi:hypothetical protein
MAERKILVSIGDATENGCEHCPKIDDNKINNPMVTWLACFEYRKILQRDNHGWPLRLPECIAAERAAGGRG